MKKKWFFIEELRRGAVSFTNSYPVFCTEKELPGIIKEKASEQLFRLLKRTTYELTEGGEQKKLNEEIK